MRKFKSMEADALLLTDAEVSRLLDPLTRRLLYVGGSRANVYLKTAFFEDGRTKTTPPSCAI